MNDDQNFYQRQIGSKTFYFYINTDGQLKAGVYQKNNEDNHRIITIRGIPKSWQLNLDCIERQKILLKALRNSHFVKVGFDIEVRARGLGGWTKKIHRRKTEKWARQLGFSKEEAQLIAESNIGMDSGETDPVRRALCPEAQSWHFNVNNPKKQKHGEPRDTRIQHAVNNLKKALEAKNSTNNFTSNKLDYKRRGPRSSFFESDSTEDAGNRSEAYKLILKNKPLNLLGQGLHALQDLFAHTNRFTYRSYNFKKTNVCWHSALGGHIPKPDNPKYIRAKKGSPETLDPADKCSCHGEPFSQRYSNTKLFTLYYLKCYLNNKELTAKELSEYVSEALHIAEYVTWDIDGNNNEKKAAAKLRWGRLKHDLGLSEQIDVASAVAAYAGVLDNVVVEGTKGVFGLV